MVPLLYNSVGVELYKFNNYGGGCQALHKGAGIFYTLFLSVVIIIITTTTIGAITLILKAEGQPENRLTTCKKIMRSATVLVIVLSISILLSAISRLIALYFFYMAEETSSMAHSSAALFILSSLSTAVNPYVQISLREDLQESIKKFFKTESSTTTTTTVDTIKSTLKKWLIDPIKKIIK